VADIDQGLDTVMSNNLNGGLKEITEARAASSGQNKGVRATRNEVSRCNVDIPCYLACTRSYLITLELESTGY